MRVLLFLALLLGCGGDAAGPKDLGPTTVVILSASVTPATSTTSQLPGGGTHTSWTKERVTVSLRNTGGAGGMKIQLWGLPTIANGPQTLLSESEIIDVPIDWAQTIATEYNTGSSNPKTRRIVVLSRTIGEVSFRQTGVYTTP